MTPEQHAIIVADTLRRLVGELEAERDQQAAEISRLREERALSINREYLGQLVRIAWMKWAAQQPDCKPSWVETWEELPERMREVDRQIGEFVASQCVTPELLRVETERDRLRAKLERVESMVRGIPIDPDWMQQHQALVQLATTIKAGLEPGKEGTNEPTK